MCWVESIYNLFSTLKMRDLRPYFENITWQFPHVITIGRIPNTVFRIQALMLSIPLVQLITLKFEPLMIQCYHWGTAIPVLPLDPTSIWAKVKIRVKGQCKRSEVILPCDILAAEGHIWRQRYAFEKWTE